MKLLRALILRPLARDRARTLLTLVSIALGVAVVIAIELAGEAATGSFRSSLETLVGATDLQITANGFIDETWMGRLATLPVNARFAPVIEAQATVEGAGSFALYGLDLLAAGDGVVVSSAVAKRLGVKLHGRLHLTLNDAAHDFEITQIPEAGTQEFLALDIATAQRALSQYGKLDRIDVFVSPRADFAEVERAIRATLPPSYDLERPGARSEENQKMLRAFRWNLRVLSYISLVVGAFLIYNTISVSVVRRRAEIGILRALGTSRTGVFWLFLGEALMLGLLGSIAGVALGRYLAAALVGMIGQTVNALYTTSTPADIHLGLGGAAVGVAVGMAVAFCSAHAPAREAMNVAPVESMARGRREHQSRLSWRRDLLWSALFAAMALYASTLEPVKGIPAGGFAAALLAIGAAAFAVPAIVLAVTRLTRNAVRKAFGAQGILASRSLAASLSRSSVVIAALATSIAMMASVGIMVGSFRETVLVWLDSQLRADLYVRPLGRSGAGQFPALSPEIEPTLRSLPGVAAVDVFHGLQFRYRGERATLGAGEIAIIQRYGRLRFLPGQDREAILASLPHQDRAIVSEPFATRFRLRAGDTLRIPIGARDVSLTVAGVYYEYSSSQGYVVLDRSTLLKYLPNQPPTNAAVYLAPGADPERMRRAVQRAVAGYRVGVAPNAELRRNAIVIFDRTFAVTWALEAVAILVAMLGAASSLLALVLDRRREIGLLRYLGASARQIRGMILLEAGMLGALACLIGFALGLALSVLLVFVVNKQSFGWTIQFHPPVPLLAGAFALVWSAAVLAGIFPARVAARLNPIEVIHEE